jgi:hypothetical protein
LRTGTAIGCIQPQSDAIAVETPAGIVIERLKPEIDAPGGGNSREAGGEARDVVDQKRARRPVGQPDLVTQDGEPCRDRSCEGAPSD